MKRVKENSRPLAVFAAKACLWFGALWIVAFYTVGFAEICTEGAIAFIPPLLFSAVLTIGIDLRAKWVRRFGALMTVVFVVLYSVGTEVFLWCGTGHDAAAWVMSLPFVVSYFCAAGLMRTRGARRWLSEDPS